VVGGRPNIARRLSLQLANGARTDEVVVSNAHAGLGRSHPEANSVGAGLIGVVDRSCFSRSHVTETIKADVMRGVRSGSRLRSAPRR
jgi:hypothetical protein